MIKLLLIYLFFISVIFGQSEMKRWGKLKELNQIAKINNDGKSTTNSLLPKLYHYIISDHDGENCPFYPSCSNFFFQSIKSNDIFTGTLMFFDRFTRDSNILKHFEGYSKYKGKYYDPVDNYYLNKNEIIIDKKD